MTTTLGALRGLGFCSPADVALGVLDLERLVLPDGDILERATQSWTDAALGLRPALRKDGEVVQEPATLVAAGTPAPMPVFAVRLRWADAGIELWYAHADVPTPDVQLDGEILDGFTLLRAFHREHKLQRSVTSLRLRNFKRDKSPWFRWPAGFVSQQAAQASQFFTRARVDFYVGFSTLPRSSWRQVAAGWVIDRVAGIGPDTVELELGQGAALLFGQTTPVPTIGDLPLFSNEVAGTVGIVDYPNWFSQIDTFDTEIPVAFGRRWVKAVPFHKGNPNYAQQVAQQEGNGVAIANLQEREVVALALGASKREWVSTTFRPGGGTLSAAIPETRQWQFARLTAKGLEVIPYEGVELFGRAIRQLRCEIDGETWYVAVMLYRPGFAITTVGDPLITTQWELLRYLAATNDDIYVLSPWGAEQSYEQDPASHLREVLERYCTGGSGTIDVDSFAAASVALAGATGAGVLEGNEPADDIIGRICSSWQMDPYIDVDQLGREVLRVRVLTPTAEDLVDRTAGVLELDDQHDVLAGSWRESIPLETERWGLASVVRWEDVPEASSPVYTRGAREFSDPGVRGLLGRRLVAPVSMAWRPTSGFAALQRNRLALYERDRPRVVVECSLPLVAARLRLGELVRVSHYAGSQADAGYSRRLFRLESLELVCDPLAPRVDVRLLDVSDLETDRPCLWDDERYWRRYGGDVPGATVSLTLGSPTVNCGFWNPVAAGVEAGDLLWLRRGVYGSEGAVIEVASATATTLTLAKDAPTTAVVTGTDFIVWRSYDTAPDNADFPGAYEGLVDARDLYGSWADELLLDDTGATGAMDPAGDPAYRYA